MAVQRGKPLHFGFEFFLATRSHKKLLLLFRAFVDRYIRSDELFIQQPVLHNEGRLSKLQRQQIYSTLQVSFL